nr:MAG TPA: hypothetical protein [Caudoviricetes sp.]
MSDSQTSLKIDRGSSGMIMLETMRKTILAT